ncbi:MAG: DNA methyltransferase, partial [Dehalococcoidales bacterium]|nr:DNA methyltransferase [Dehalococcoidales bacterium]
MASNMLYYGDNLEVLRKYIGTGTIDLCYIDPPFNSKRTYNQIYNDIGTEDRAQTQAFIDTWTWDDRAREGFQEILDNPQGRYTKQTIELVKGLSNALRTSNLFAYLISMTLRITEIQRVLKKTGSFYLHCDPTASHYLKLITDSIFVPNGGEFRNEVIWAYRLGGRPQKGWPRKHDAILYYTKTDTDDYTFNADAIRVPYESTGGYISSGRKIVNGKEYKVNPLGKVPEDWWFISALNRQSKERLGYPTQKPEALLERIIKASSNEGDMVLDAYCGCGTTIAVAQDQKRKWIGMDITYQSIALILKRIEDHFGKIVADNVKLDGIPRDMDSAHALANKKDDRVRKEFEKWAVLTYTTNRAVINQKKGADSGIDGVAYFRTNNTDNAKIILQVKSGGVGRGDIAKLRGDMQRETAAMAVFITLEPPTAPMVNEAKAAGLYHHD